MSPASRWVRKELFESAARSRAKVFAGVEGSRDHLEARSDVCKGVCWRSMQPQAEPVKRFLAANTRGSSFRPPLGKWPVHFHVGWWRVHLKAKEAPPFLED